MQEAVGCGIRLHSPGLLATWHICALRNAEGNQFLVDPCALECRGSYLPPLLIRCSWNRNRRQVTDTSASLLAVTGHGTARESTRPDLDRSDDLLCSCGPGLNLRRTPATRARLATTELCDAAAARTMRWHGSLTQVPPFEQLPQVRGSPWQVGLAGAKGPTGVDPTKTPPLLECVSPLSAKLPSGSCITPTLSTRPAPPNAFLCAVVFQGPCKLRETLTTSWLYCGPWGTAPVLFQEVPVVCDCNSS
jgi:hypothetical protein